MTVWNVTIKATVTKTQQVEADTLEKAEELAHDEFSVLNTHNDEYYEQETIDIKEAE